MKAGGVRSGRRPGRAAGPGRVSSEVGSGGSCAGVLGGHTPLQVPLRETCGAFRVPSGDRLDGSRATVSAETPGRPDRARSCA